MIKGVLPTEEIHRRLAFLKYLLSTAEGLSRKGHPTSAVGLLLLHDAVEMLVDFACTNFEVVRDKELKKAWGDLKAKGINLTHLSAINKLNLSRVNLKHHGVSPSSGDLESFRVIAYNFYEETCLNLFGLDFKTISLSDLIADPRVQARVKTSEMLFAQSQPLLALEELGIAFEELVDLFIYGDSHYPNHHFSLGYEIGELSGTERHAQPELASVILAVNQMRHPLQLIMMGIDYKKYNRFRLTVPKARRLANGSYHVFPWRPDVPSTEACEEAVLFVIEAALNLQSTQIATRQINGKTVLLDSRDITDQEDAALKERSKSYLRTMKIL